jgi:hypothetical protein
MPADGASYIEFPAPQYGLGWSGRPFDRSVTLVASIDTVTCDWNREYIADASTAVPLVVVGVLLVVDVDGVVGDEQARAKHAAISPSQRSFMGISYSNHTEAILRESESFPSDSLKVSVGS